LENINYSEEDVIDDSTPLLTDISLLITELSKLKEKENVDIKLYTNNR
jgi:hypothetical protein